MVKSHKRSDIVNIGQSLAIDRKHECEADGYMLWIKQKKDNINWRDVQIKNVVNNVDMSSLKAPWQNGPYKN